MFDQALAVLVVILPTLFAVGIEAVSKEIKEHPYWRVAVLAFGIGLSVLTWVQMSRATKAAIKDRESAILETSQRVSTSVSQSVSKALTDQYAGMIADQKKQIGELQTKLDAQSKDVSAIKGSNIVTGKRPVKVEVINGQSANGSAQVENIRMSWEPEVSTHNDAPFAKKVTIQADANVNPVKLAIFCDVPLKYGEVKLADAYIFYGGNEIYSKDARVYLLNMNGQGTSILRPDAPIVVHLYSEKPINILRGEQGPR